MSNCALVYPFWGDINTIYAPAFASFGSWSGSLPLTNLQTRTLSEVARSTNALAASTKFRIDLGVARQVGLLALVASNISVAGTVRWRGYSDAGYSVLVYDSTTVDAWPVVYPAGSLVAGDPRLVTGKYCAEEAVGFVPDAIHVPTTVQSARYWMCEITDTANPDGYVQIGRLVIGGRYAPTVNMVYGAKLQLSTATTRDETDGGAAVYDPKAVRRSQAFTVENLTDDEALANVFEIQRRLGTSGQTFFVFDQADTYHMTRRSFLCTLKELNGLEFPWCAHSQTAFAVIEEL